MSASADRTTLFVSLVLILSTIGSITFALLAKDERKEEPTLVCAPCCAPNTYPPTLPVCSSYSESVLDLTKLGDLSCFEGHMVRTAGDAAR